MHDVGHCDGSTPVGNYATKAGDNSVLGSRLVQTADRRGLCNGEPRATRGVVIHPTVGRGDAAHGSWHESLVVWCVGC